MQAMITYCLSEAAQRAQMMATGQPVTRTQSTVEDVPVEWLTHHLCEISSDGKVTFDLTQKVLIGKDGTIGQYGWSGFGPELSAQPESGLDALKAFAAGVESQSARCATQFAASKIEMAANEARHAAEYAKTNERVLAERAIAAAKAASEKAEAAAKEKAKSDAIDAFIAASGDALLIQQHADHMVCRSEIASRMAESTLAFLGPEYPDSVVCEDSDCKCQDLAVKCLPNRIYAAWKAISMPEGATADFRKVRNCLKAAADDSGDERFLEETAGPVEYHAIITVPHGPFQFERRIKLEPK